MPLAYTELADDTVVEVRPLSRCRCGELNHAPIGLSRRNLQGTQGLPGVGPVTDSIPAFLDLRTSIVLGQPRRRSIVSGYRPPYARNDALRDQTVPHLGHLLAGVTLRDETRLADLGLEDGHGTMIR